MNNNYNNTTYNQKNVTNNACRDTIYSQMNQILTPCRSRTHRNETGRESQPVSLRNRSRFVTCYARNVHIFYRIFGTSAEGMAEYSVFGQITIRGISIKKHENVDSTIYNHKESLKNKANILTLFKCMVYIEKCEVVTINVSESHLGIICSLLCFIGSHETLWD